MATDIRPGVLLDGKYEILNLLGAGGMGEVFKARHVHLNAFRCIKVMKQGLLADDVYRTRFLREAQLATQIHHPNIAVVHDFFLAERGSYMVTEFIDGTTVRQWAKAFGRFPLALAADLAVQVLAGLDHIHRRGLLHRDISADNIMLSYERDDSLVAKIIDLGIAKDVNVATNETQAGMLVGNPKYMSPEQLGDLAAGEQVDHRADLYGLGVVLYEMLLGVPPFTSETPHGYIVKHLTQPPRPFVAAAPGIDWPEGLEAVIVRALEKDRRNRYADAREFSGALQRYLTAPPGSLTRTAVTRLRASGAEKTLVDALPPEAATEVTPPTVVESDTRRDWKKTIAEDSIEGYREYIEKHPDAPDTTEAKARIFELSLLEDLRKREDDGDQAGVKRLAEGHPPGSLVGNAARDALLRMRTAQQVAEEEESDFQRAWENGTSAAWRVFIDKYASSPRAARAQEFLDEAVAFEAATVTDSDTTGLREFLKSWPEGRHHLEGEIRLVTLKERAAETVFAQAAATGTAEALRDFLSRFPTSSRVGEAQQALDELQTEKDDFAKARAGDSAASWSRYLAAHASGAHAGEARARLAAMEDIAFAGLTASKDPNAGAAFLADFPASPRRDEVARLVAAWTEPRDWDAAWEAGSVAAWDRYLAAHPDAARAAEARLCRQEAVDFDLAVGTNSASMWRAFLKAWPDGRHRLDAEVRLRSAK